MGFTLKNERKIYGTVLQKGNLMNEIRLAWVGIVLVSRLIPKSVVSLGSSTYRFVAVLILEVGACNPETLSCWVVLCSVFSFSRILCITFFVSSLHTCILTISNSGEVVIIIYTNYHIQ